MVKGMISRVIKSGEEYQYNLSDKDGKVVCKGVYEKDLVRIRDKKAEAGSEKDGGSEKGNDKGDSVEGSSV